MAVLHTTRTEQSPAEQIDPVAAAEIVVAVDYKLTMARTRRDDREEGNGEW